MRLVKNLIGGEILAEPIMMDEKNVLVPKGTAIKIDYLPLIESLGIDSLMIEDPYEDYEKPHYLISKDKFDSYVDEVRQNLENHVHSNADDFCEFQKIAREIVKDIDALSDDAAIDVGEHSSDLYEHTVMVTLLSVLVAQKLKFSQKRQYEIAVGCLLHDLGLRYITVDYHNLDMNKRDQIEEFEYRKHTILGYSALENAKWVPEISKKMIIHHHERLDKSGFPMKQTNEEIECRIIQVCDCLDCMISGIEAKRMSVRDAVMYLRNEQGTKFDPQIVDILCNRVALYPVGTTIVTDHEPQTVVVSQTVNPERPIVMVLDEGDEEKREGVGQRLLNLFLEKEITILQVD